MAKLVDREGLKAFRQENDERYAKPDGNYPTLTAGLADNLTPYSEDSGASQENPFISNGTGTNNNTEIVTVGDYGLLKEKQGNTLVVNQLVNTGDTEITTISGHKYLTFINGVYAIVTSSGSAITLNDDNVDKVIDLTKMFNGNIPADLINNPYHFSWYYNGDLSYNTGTLVNANGVKLVSTGRNIYNPNETYNVVIPNKPFFASKTTTITYYDKDKNVISTESVSAGNTFTTPSNCSYINSSISAIAITPYYTDQDGGEGYKDTNNLPIEYTYEAPYVVDTGNEVLRKAGNVKDYKEPNGTIHRLVGVVDLGTLNWNISSNERAYANISSYGMKLPSSTALKGNIVCSKLSNIEYANLNASPTSYNEVIALSSDTFIQLRSTSLLTDVSTREEAKQALSGIMLIFELATPTTEQGTPFAENLPINDYGMLYWLDENDELVGIPQGAKIFYPTNYKGFLDDMYSKVDGDSSKYVIDSDLLASETKRDIQDTILQNAIGGTLRQCLCVKESLDFNNTAFVDLGSLTFTRNSYGSIYCFDCSFPNAKPSTVNVLVNALSTLFRTVTWSGSRATTFVNDNTFTITSSGVLEIRCDTYTDAITFKNAMKGVLLAYEKA